MKTKFSFKPEGASEPVVLHFLRTLNTEKMYRDILSEKLGRPVEFLADLTTTVQISKDLSQDKDGALERYLDLNFSTTRHDLLTFMYARVENGTLIQDDASRKEYENLCDKYDFSEDEALGACLKS
jgi:hypothetical protein